MVGRGGEGVGVIRNCKNYYREPVGAEKIFNFKSSRAILQFSYDNGCFIWRTWYFLFRILQVVIDINDHICWLFFGTKNDRALFSLQDTYTTAHKVWVPLKQSIKNPCFFLTRNHFITKSPNLRLLYIFAKPSISTVRKCA